MFLSKLYGCHTIDKQDAPWLEENKNMNVTVVIYGIFHGTKTFLKMYMYKKMSQTIVSNTRAKHAYTA